MAEFEQVIFVKMWYKPQAKRLQGLQSTVLDIICYKAKFLFNLPIHKYTISPLIQYETKNGICP